MNQIKTRKLFTGLMLAMLPMIGIAADNSIYIDQLGDFTNIIINQDGSGNQVRGLSAVESNDPTASSIIRGNGINININQTGSSNKMNLGIDAIMGSSASVNFVYSTVNQGNISGSNNNAIFQLGSSSSRSSDTIVSVIQLNGGNTAKVAMFGSDNQLTATQSGGNATLVSNVNASGTRQTITTSGGTNNSVTTNITGDNANNTIDIVGASNTIDITQSGVGGIIGHQSVMDITGTGNNITLAQSGSAQSNVFNLKIGASGTAANSNAYNITQTSR
jgi:hypothetical protein